MTHPGLYSPHIARTCNLDAHNLFPASPCSCSLSYTHSFYHTPSIAPTHTHAFSHSYSDSLTLSFSLSHALSRKVSLSLCHSLTLSPGKHRPVRTRRALLRHRAARTRATNREITLPKEAHPVRPAHVRGKVSSSQNVSLDHTTLGQVTTLLGRSDSKRTVFYEIRQPEREQPSTTALLP